jgi:hypothetical protein
MQTRAGVPCNPAHLQNLFPAFSKPEFSLLKFNLMVREIFGLTYGRHPMLEMAAKRPIEEPKR